ncbi:hypothetical protein [Pseudomonas sp. nanlin1]|uniref:hypothetical protein n=1 Tax=Pseudomonas sp. nanlin1 TaxID=3040605 RepID=UPI003890E5A1
MVAKFAIEAAIGVQAKQLKTTAEAECTDYFLGDWVCGAGLHGRAIGEKHLAISTKIHVLLAGSLE